jgi:hypothetical protein
LVRGENVRKRNVIIFTLQTELMLGLFKARQGENVARKEKCEINTECWSQRLGDLVVSGKITLIYILEKQVMYREVI